MRVLGYSDTSGSRWWRMASPFRWVEREGIETAIGNEMNGKDMDRADIVVLHNIINTDGLAELYALRELSGYKKKIVADVDDALFVEDTNPHKKHWDNTSAKKILEISVTEADIVTASTEKVAEMIRPLNNNVRVVPNYYDPDWFDIPNSDNTDERFVRVGWAGSVTHEKDFAFVAPAINTLMDTHKNVKMIICGDFRFKELLTHKDRVEVYTPVSLEAWPMKLYSLSLDIGIAPLADTTFNCYKSPIKWMEYTLAGVLPVTSDIVYKGYSLVRAKTVDEWTHKLSRLVEDKDKRRLLLQQNMAEVFKYNIRNNYKKWIEAWTK